MCEECLPTAEPQRIEIGTLRVRGLGVYAGGLRKAILALKDGRKDVARSMGLRLATLTNADAHLVPVPTTLTRKAVRGFDGAEMLADVCAKASGAQVHRLLAQISGDAQRGRDRRERLAARGRFACRDSDLQGREFVLVDDVMTTGSTLQDCASALRAASGVVHEAIVIAVAPLGGTLNRHS